MLVRVSRASPVITAIGASLAVSCSDPVGQSISQPEPLTRIAVAEGSPRRPGEAMLESLSAAVPGFSGLFIAADGAIVGRAVAGADIRALEQAIVANLPQSLRDKRPLRFETAGFSFAELKKVREAAWRAPHTGLVSIDLDEQHGVVVVEVEAAEGAAELERWLTAEGVPSEAVRFRVAALNRRLVDLGAQGTNLVSCDSSPCDSGGGTPIVETLRSQVRPVPGGFQFTHALLQLFPVPRIIPSQCTVGVNGRWNNAVGFEGFVTASHCTPDPFGGISTFHFWQPLNGPTSSIGFEFLDPFPFTCPGTAHPGRVCRYSDAAFVRYNAGSTAIGAFAQLARPFGSFPALGLPSGTIDVLGRLTVVGVLPSLVLGEEIHKLGRTTGWTRGTVTSTCNDRFVIDDVSGQSIVFLCQDGASVRALKGDSGGPVFKWYSETDSSVLMVGILWGGNSTTSWFSGMNNISIELPSVVFPF